jgi:hypothetical protein
LLMSAGRNKFCIHIINEYSVMSKATLPCQ